MTFDSVWSSYGAHNTDSACICCHINVAIPCSALLVVNKLYVAKLTNFPCFSMDFFCSKNICFYYYRDLSQHIRRNFINSLLKSVKTRSLKMYTYLCSISIWAVPLTLGSCIFLLKFWKAIKLTKSKHQNNSQLQPINPLS